MGDSAHSTWPAVTVRMLPVLAMQPMAGGLSFRSPCVKRLPPKSPESSSSRRRAVNS